MDRRVGAEMHKAAWRWIQEAVGVLRDGEVTKAREEGEEVCVYGKDGRKEEEERRK